MPCSVSTARSGRWLERLRAARGFPASDASSDLGRFLLNPNRSIADNNPEERKANADPIGLPPQSRDRDLRNIVTGVLNELFNFGDKCVATEKLKKSSRKQINPKNCTYSNGRSHNGTLEKGKLRVTDDTGSSGVEGAKQVASFGNEEEGGDRDEENLSGFSRTEVTVIDTSYGPWKFEKLLYRQKNVWRVRDKKGKSEIMVRKKRKPPTPDAQKGAKSRVDYKIKGGLDREMNKFDALEKDPSKMASASTSNKEKRTMT